MRSLFVISLIFSNFLLADPTVVWKGKVAADGTPSKVVELKLKNKYLLKASGEVNLGKWWQAGKALGEDACFEYNGPNGPTPLTTLRNSLDISVCDGKFHENHIYQSEAFTAKENRIHFWIYDTDYSDNLGSLDVEVIDLGAPENPSEAFKN